MSLLFRKLLKTQGIFERTINMKKFFAIALCAMILTSSAALSGCGGSSGESKTSSSSAAQSSDAKSSENSKTASAGSFSESDLIAQINGKEIELGENIDSALSKLGEAKNVTSELSCRGEGEDKTYEYDGFNVYTVPFDGVDKVTEITISSGISTPKGISIGDSEEKVTETYGSNFKKIGKFISYSIEDKSLQFFMTDGKVSEIDYNYDVM